MNLTLINIWMLETWISFGMAAVAVYGYLCGGGVEESDEEGDDVPARPVRVQRPRALNPQTLASALAVVQEEQEQEEQDEDEEEQSGPAESSFVSFSPLSDLPSSE
ncbi:hypothetical protein P3342_012355 [Pyrenophora teres f. teres]|nr:hypothetical protein P3342_012355 [Pyrenophora teres f. teres]